MVRQAVERRQQMAKQELSWWQVALITAGTAVLVAVVKKLVDRISDEKVLTFDRKLNRLNEALSAGRITDGEWQKGRMALMDAYPGQK